MSKANIQRKDTVQVLSGKEKGKKGEVLKIDLGRQRVWVAKLNIVTKHAKPSQTQSGGLQKMEAPIHISNVMLVCPKCAAAIRPKRDALNDGKRVRICRKCGEVIL